MKASELRIGNLILLSYATSGIFRITEIAKDRCMFYDDLNKFSSGTILPYIQPIPFTEEWLLKFGAISNFYKDRYELPVKNEFIFIDCDQSRTPNLWMAKYPHIKHVHQLQNLFHAITGEELTLTES
jgi:hypothetical protein